MSHAVAKQDDVVSLDEYRRTRGGRPARRATALPPPMAPVWVYWVPVWIW